MEEIEQLFKRLVIPRFDAIDQKLHAIDKKFERNDQDGVKKA